MALILLMVTVLGSCSEEDAKLILETPDDIEISSDFALKIELSWDEVPKAEGYTIYRADYDPFSGDDPDDLDYDKLEEVEEAEYVDLEVESNSTYYYIIEAFAGDVKSEESDPEEGSTLAITAEEAFDVLAEYTAGKRYDAALASEVPTIILDVIAENAKTSTDLVFIIDNTGSMGDDLSAIKNAIDNIIASLPSGTRLSAAVYNDENSDPTAWYEYIDLTTNHSTVKSFIDGIFAYGGGDIPESVYHGIYKTVDNLSWSSSSKRMMIVIGDAPPLEGDLSAYSLKDVVDKCNEERVVVNLYPILID